MTHDSCEVKTITVELQRPGPPHNRLLSPLTRYLASSSEAEVREVSYVDEHAQLLRKLKYLRAMTARDDLAGHEERLLTVRELSRDVSRFLAGIPGLLGQLSQRGCDNPLLHLEIVTSAAELAMLPYELSGSIESAGENPNLLLLSGRPRVSLTRRSRSVSGGCVRWPNQPKILFVAGFPTASIPFDEHLDALMRALQPWVPPLDGPKAGASERARANADAFNRQLTVLENATIDEVAQACAHNDYTHVHILAHGAPNPRVTGKQFGMRLAGAKKAEPHVVSGEQFATAIRRDGGRGGPTIVTVAACDGGHVNEVLHTGATFLHDLHRSGVPFVVGSQFPLSMEGSVDLCQKLYEGLLRGDDPRQLLADLRLRLHSRFAERNHDWASLVVYAAFPPDLNRQLEELRYRQGRRALNVAISHFDEVMQQWPATSDGGPVPPAPAPSDQLPQAGEAPATPPPPREQTTPNNPPSSPGQTVETEINKLIERIKSAAALVPDEGRFRIDGLALVAVAEKRVAEALFKIGRPDKLDKLDLSLDYLEKAAAHYDRSFDEGVRYDDAEAVMAPLHWSLTQQLSLWLALGRASKPGKLATTARFIADQDMDVGRPQAETWALTTLLELDVIDAWLAAKDETDNQPKEVTEPLAALAERTARLLRSPDNADAVYSTRRQLARYTRWWWTDDFRKSPELAKRAPKPTHELFVPPVLRTAVETAIAQMEDYIRRNPGSVARRR